MQQSEDERAERLLAVLGQCDARLLPQFIEALKAARQEEVFYLLRTE